MTRSQKPRRVREEAHLKPINVSGDVWCYSHAYPVDAHRS
jgi:hypothetical protein